MHALVLPRLSMMMFLQFFAWGAWYTTVGNYMAKHGMSDAIYWAYTVGPIAAMISPFFLGMVADRFFATERVLGMLHILGGIAIYLAPSVVQMKVAAEAPADGTLQATAESSSLFIALLLLHMLCYMPTLGLTNTLAFHNITNQEKQFPIIRVFGTLGWIAAGIVVSKILQADEQALPLKIAGASGVLMGVYSLTLPHTPPPAAGRRATAGEILGLDAVALMKRPSFAVFIISSLLVCIPLAAYYAYAPVYVKAAGLENPAFKMTFGQMSEVFFMFVMPAFFAVLGVKWMLAFGMLAWVLRYGLFASAATAAPTPAFWMVIGGVVLHGICYDFFFVTGQIYTDKAAGPSIRGQAQGFLVLVTQGIGMLLGTFLSGQLFNRLVGEGAALKQWQTFWWVPCIAAAVIMLAFIALFRDDSRRAAEVTEGQVAEDAMYEGLR